MITKLTYHWFEIPQLNLALRLKARETDLLSIEMVIAVLSKPDNLMFLTLFDF